MRWRLLVGSCRFAVSLACASLALGAAHAGPAVAQPPAASAAATPDVKPAPAGPLWHELTAQQRQILAPVINEWNGFSRHKKQRLINIAKRYPDMSADEQAKIQARLPHWLELPQTSRDEARVNMKKLLQLPPDERKRRDSFGAVVEKSDIEGLAIERAALALARAQRFDLLLLDANLPDGRGEDRAVGGPDRHDRAGRRQRALHAPLREFAPDVVLSYWLYPDAFGAMRAARRAGCAR